jgi:MOSC domain-containing protein YiiM
MGKVMAVCISEKRGTQKNNISEGVFIENFGIENDAHAGDWHRQVSVLSYDSVEDFKTLPVGTILKCGNVLLKITQIGKEWHAHCEIYKKVGDCIMPREGVFAKVIKDGKIAVGDDLFEETI